MSVTLDNMVKKLRLDELSVTYVDPANVALLVAAAVRRGEIATHEAADYSRLANLLYSMRRNQET